MGKFLKLARSMFLIGLVAVIVSTASSSFAEEIKLTTIVPSQEGMIGKYLGETTASLVVSTGENKISNYTPPVGTRFMFLSRLTNYDDKHSALLGAGFVDAHVTDQGTLSVKGHLRVDAHIGTRLEGRARWSCFE